MEDAELYCLQDKEFDKAKLAYQFRLGHCLVASNRELNDLPTNMRQPHEYYMVNTTNREYIGFKALIIPQVVFNRPDDAFCQIWLLV